MALATIAPDKRHLTTPQGNPFFILGVNYAGYFDRAWQMWEDDLYDPELITRDFRKAQNSGFNSVRLFAHRALINDLRDDKYTKLDEVLALAQDHQLSVLFTFNDIHSLYLEQVAELDAKIVERYRDEETILGYDLENEPVFYSLAAAVYPNSRPAPIQTSQLVDQYGERVSRSEAIDMQQNRKIPSHLSQDVGYYYINALHLFLEYNSAINEYVQAGKGNIVDFMLSAEAESWYPLITVLDGTVDAWLKTRMEPIQATNNNHLLTVGWNWLQFAVLPANRQLDFQSYHNYASNTLAGFNANTLDLVSLQQAFPQHPITFGEFGWSNQSSRTPETSQAVSQELTMLYEAATYAYMRANKFGGGYKWQLNDLVSQNNPYEASFGVFGIGDEAKSLIQLTEKFSETWPDVDTGAQFTLLREVSAGFSYRLDFPQQVTVGGNTYQDQTLSWQGQGISHCFINIDSQELRIEAQGSGILSIDPWVLIPNWDRARKSVIYRAFSNEQRTQQQEFEAGETVTLDLVLGGQYIIAMGGETTVTPPEGGTEIDPGPGEHVVLLGDFEDYMDTTIKYIRRFAPDFTFATDQVAGRWSYVSVVAPQSLIPDETLDNIRSLGAILVERVIGDTPEATKVLLDDMAERGQRFLSATSPIPPQEEPPEDPEESTSEPEVEAYVVEPGDTLSKIAQKVYGEARLWTLIYEANRDKLSSPSLIRVGMELTIPTRQA